MWWNRAVVAVLVVATVGLSGCVGEGAPPCSGYGAISSLSELYPVLIVVVGTVVEGDPDDPMEGDEWEPWLVAVADQPWQSNEAMPSHVGETVTVLVRTPPSPQVGESYAFYALPDAANPDELFHSRLAIDTTTDVPLNESPLLARESAQATAFTGGSLVDAAIAITAEQSPKEFGRVDHLPGPVSDVAFANPAACE